jgi:glyoxylase-like metal-dependent hydrolase (beta-lactamase superfamily II)
MLLIRIARVGNPPVVANSTTGLTCGSRYHLPGDDPALLDLTWSTPDARLFVSVHTPAVTAGATGVFEPDSVLISSDADSWLGGPGNCRLTITVSSKIGQEDVAVSMVREIFRVAGQVACTEWVPPKPGETLEEFRFTTRAVLIRPR